MSTSFTRLKVERTGEGGPVLRLTLDNPRMMNALDEAMQLELLAALGEANGDNSIRCVVLQGAGDKAFCSGGDISAFRKLDVVSGYDYLYQRGNSIQRLLTTMEKPVIAAVAGMCYAGGLELALACDFIYATESARFGLLEINLGVLAGWGGTVRLPRAIPERRAREMIYRGEVIDSAEALRVGLVNRVFSSRPELDRAVDQTAAELCAKAPLALRAAKNVIQNSLTCESIDAALAIERGSIMWLQGTQDAAEGVAAFLEKRRPSFQGK